MQERKVKLKEIREVYESQRNEIIKKLSAKKDELDLDGDELDRIQGVGIANIMNQLSARDVARLNRLEIAINRCEDGSVTECEECGNNIGVKRLLAFPGVTICIMCAEALEKSKRNYM